MRKVLILMAAVLLAAVVLVGVAASMGTFWPFNGQTNIMRLPGVVEIQEVRLGSKIGGRVEEADPLLEGTLAKPNQVLVKIEVPELKAQFEQAEAQVGVAKANLDLAEDQYIRGTQLYPSRAISEEDYRQREFTYRQMRAQLTQSEARVRELKADLREAEVLAPEHVLVEVMSVRKGDLVMPNQPIVRVLRVDDLWVKVYVPETELHRFKLGQEADVTIDGLPNQQFKGTIQFISAESEFTPRNVQSADERRHQVFGMKVRIADPKGYFKSGMAAEVTFKF